MDVWLPPGYSPRRKYPVIYMQDGQMLFDSTINWNHQEWRVDEMLDRLIRAQNLRPCIVVGIWNTPDRRVEYYPAKAFAQLPRAVQDTLRKDLGDPTAQPRSDAYLRFIVEELKPFIDSAYSTQNGRKNTFIMGSSMGGLISMYAICEYPEVFGGAACLSTHWPGSVFRNDPNIAAGFVAYLEQHLPDPATHRFYFDYGTATLDAWYEPYQKEVDKRMAQHGYTAKNWITLRFEGEEHSERAWGKRLDRPLMFLLGKRQR
ncbi:MAG TPA: alpha/beta fold hydrolase [Saprospiraceae bacterium]|nr:alpha/beta fold hydrolase [Saprospiraceae bacterium]HNM25936.1 alpha/beta fold hydrolase [Saprospiraceae bacterium]